MLPQQFLASNSENLDDWFRRLEQDLAPVIGDRTLLSVGAAKDSNEQLKNSPLSWLFDNPIVNFIMKLNPIPVAMEALTESFGEELGNDFPVPNLGQVTQRAAEALSKAFHKEIDVKLSIGNIFYARPFSTTSVIEKTLQQLVPLFSSYSKGHGLHSRSCLYKHA